MLMRVHRLYPRISVNNGGGRAGALAHSPNFSTGERGGSPNYRLHFAAKIELYVAGACICVWLGLFFFFGIIVSEVL